MCKHIKVMEIGVADWCENCGAVRLTGARVWVSPEVIGYVHRLRDSMLDGIARKKDIVFFLTEVGDL